MDKYKIIDDIEEIQHKVDAIGFKGQNEYDLYLREELADYIVKNYVDLAVVGNSWLSPVDSEREWQEKHLLKIWDNYPNASPLWQYMNGLIRFTCERLNIDIDLS